MPDSRQLKRRRRTAVSRFDRLALACAGRVCRDAEGAVWLVKGRPAPLALYDSLAPLPHDLPALPHPRRLGFEASQLQRLSRADLCDWRRELSWVRKQAPRESNAAGRALAALYDDALTATQRQLDWIETQMAEDCPPGYPLGPSSAGELAASIAEIQGLYLPPAWEWMARLLVWLDGPLRVRPLLQSLRPYLMDRENFVAAAGLVRFRAQLEKWLEEGRRRPQKLVGRLPDLALEAVCALPRRLVDAAQFDLPGPRRNPITACRELLHRTNELLAGCDKRLTSAVPAMLTALFAGRLADRPLSGFWLHGMYQPTKPGTSHPRPRWYVEALAAEGRQRDYGRMLATLEAAPDRVWPSSLRSIRRAYAAGASAADLRWLEKMGIAWQFTPATRAASRIEQLLNTRNVNVNHHWLRLFNARTPELALAAAQWLSRLPRSDLTAASRAAVLELVERLLVEEPLFGQCRDLFLALLRAGDEAPPQAASDAGGWLECIRSQRAVAGGTPTLPGRIQRVVDRAAREARERAWLERHAGGEGWTSSRAARLALLAARTAASRDHAGERRLLAWAHEACATSAAEAAARIIASKVNAWWRAVVGPDRPELSTQDRTKLCLWGQSLKPTSSRDLMHIMDAWNTHGADYRRHLVGNARWLAAAQQQGVDLQAWFAPPAAEAVVAGQRVRIERAADPIEVLLMGTWFDTCLDLGNGENRDSALANAYEADKAVLYVRLPGGRRIARKLVALTAECRLLGYATYFADWDWGDEALESTEKKLQVNCALERYAAAWAVRAGLAGLGNEGVPTIRKQRFWYDDNAAEWPTPAPESAATLPPAAAPPLAAEAAVMADAGAVVAV